MHRVQSSREPRAQLFRVNPGPAEGLNRNPVASAPRELANEPMSESLQPSMAQRIGLFLGPVAFLVLLALPPADGLSDAGWRTLAVAVLMAVFWMTEAIPIPATALLPLALLPVLGVQDMKATAAPYANDLVFLQMGGFMLAVAMERWGLHRRIALFVVAKVGASPRRLVLGFMLAAAFISMWISNSATTAMMLPIAIAISLLFRDQDQEGPFDLGICLVLGLAYASTMGGVATLIGTPPNVVLAGAASELLGIEIGFFEWMVVGLPLTCVMLPLGWVLLTRWLHPPTGLRGDAAAVIAKERAGLGKISWPEVAVATVFTLTALSWVLRAPKDLGGLQVPGIQTWFPAVKDSTIAMVASVVLFLIPVNWRKGQFILDWKTASKLPWGVLVLFGGGLSLAGSMKSSGLATWIGSSVESFASMPTWLIFLLVATMFVFLTELTSNLATTTMAMPVMLGAAVGLGVAPLALMATAAMSASMAFMLPAATPPNAIVFGSGYLSIPQMVRAGIYLNLVAILAVTAVALWLVPIVLG